MKLNLEYIINNYIVIDKWRNPLYFCFKKGNILDTFEYSNKIYPNNRTFVWMTNNNLMKNHVDRTYFLQIAISRLERKSWVGSSFCVKFWVRPKFHIKTFFQDVCPQSNTHKFMTKRQISSLIITGWTTSV